MGNSAAPRVVCFDLGGVLVRICRGWPEACAQAALPARDPERLSGDEWRKRRLDPGDRYQRGLIECNAYFSELAASIDGLYSAAELERMHGAWTLDHYPGALDLVRALNATPGVDTACLSNTNHAHWIRLAGLNGRNEYPAVRELRHQLASHLLGCAKPDPRIYELAQATFAKVLPVRASDILFFDDLAENVSAARAAGWSAFQVDPSGDPVHQMRGILTDAGIAL